MVVASGYYFGLGLFAPELELFWVWDLNRMLQLLFSLCLMLPLSVALFALYWHQDHWDKHPIATQLAELSSGGSWRAVAAAINTEFRRVDKFASGSVYTVCVTVSWSVHLDGHVYFGVRLCICAWSCVLRAEKLYGYVSNIVVWGEKMK